MNWEQVVTPNLDIAYRGGWCQRANENSVGLKGIYASAYRAWLANVQHAEAPPRGLYVPVYLSMPRGPKDEQGLQQGDVAISCPDGSIAAAALPGENRPLFRYPSLNAYIADYARNNGGATYLGWGEFIGSRRIVRVKEEEVKLTIEQQDKALKMGLQREPSEAELNNPDWRNSPGLLIDTLWTNGGEAIYKESQGKTTPIPSEVVINGVSYVRK